MQPSRRRRRGIPTDGSEISIARQGCSLPRLHRLAFSVAASRSRAWADGARPSPPARRARTVRRGRPNQPRPPQLSAGTRGRAASQRCGRRDGLLRHRCGRSSVRDAPPGGTRSLHEDRVAHQGLPALATTPDRAHPLGGPTIALLVAPEQHARPLRRPCDGPDPAVRAESCTGGVATDREPPTSWRAALGGPGPAAPPAGGAARAFELRGALRDPLFVGDQLPHRRAAGSRPADLTGRLQFTQQLEGAGIAGAGLLGDRVRAQSRGGVGRSRSSVSDRTAPPRERARVTGAARGRIDRCGVAAFPPSRAAGTGLGALPPVAGSGG